MLDILCIGDSVVDIFLKIPENNNHFELDKKNNKLLIDFGEKINVEKYVLEIGGNATNTSVGLSRLGLITGICTEIGNDEFSQKVIARLNEEKIQKNLVIQDPDQKTSFSVVINYHAERTIFSEHVKRNHEFDFKSVDTKCVYLTSLGMIWEKAYKQTLDYIKSSNAILAFNPGTLQLEKRDNLVLEIVENSDYLFLNKEEAEVLLYGKEINLSNLNERESIIKRLLFGLKGLGAKNIIITDSNNGSYLLDIDHKYYKLGILDSEVLEKTGAGDSYTSGFLAAIIDGNNVRDAMVWGSINASSVVTKIGAQEGLLSKSEMLEKINSNKDFSPKEF
jgi:sugar/nucleoside kinase (ribokinase family)